MFSYLQIAQCKQYDMHIIANLFNSNSSYRNPPLPKKKQKKTKQGSYQYKDSVLPV